MLKSRSKTIVALLALLIVGALITFLFAWQTSEPLPQPNAPAPLIVINKGYVDEHSRFACECVFDQRLGVFHGSTGGPCVILNSTPPTKNQAICEQKRINQYNDFETELKNQFAAIPDCSGITAVSSFDDVTSIAKSTQSYWWCSRAALGPDLAKRAGRANALESYNTLELSRTGLCDH